MITMLTSLLSGASVRIALAGLALIASAAGGAWVTANHKNVEIADLHRAYTEERARSASEASATLQAAVLRGDALSARVAIAESASQTQLEETNHAIRRITTGRNCLGSAAVRLLNDPAGFRAAAVPTPTGQSIEPDAAFASDTDVGLWANSARRQYETCRGRLQAVADFYEAAPSE